jgi:NitT/TauT family transport system substrate-binding protein
MPLLPLQSVRHRLTISLSLLAALLPAFLLSDAAWAQTRVVFGTSGSLGDASLAVAVAIDRGFYRDAGIIPEVIDFKGGAPAVQALVSGGIQYCICAPEHVVRMRTRGLDGVVAFALDTRHTYVLVAKDSSPAHQFADLKGKHVGITSPGSLTENLILLQAKRQGFDASRDLEMIGVGVSAAQKAAIDSGRIEAGMFGNVDAVQLLGRGYRAVFDWRTQTVPSLALLSRQRILDDNPQAARAVVQATLKAQQLILDNKAIAIEALAKLYPTLDRAAIEGVAAELPHRLSRTGIYTREAFDHLQNDLFELEPDLKRVDYGAAEPRNYFTKRGS